uniref:3-polyprenyl-4-hydroxybenzoate decarboxylase UbiX n=1 Tax=uncultured organism TaxID=155900 RepID=M1PR93_9ZZZZ|nr:3-polyprenyl-4-hydroxybenzoate decarboxylase UbiX [uncultured organism]
MVAVTGASGSALALELLRWLREATDWELHVVVSAAALRTARLELGVGREAFAALADAMYANKDIGASIASGSFATLGMVVIPCSMNTLAAIAHGLGDTLIARAADVTLKERRRLVLVPRETPLNLIHLRNMTAVTEAGAVVAPPVPAFYLGELTPQRLVQQIAMRVASLFGVAPAPWAQWTGEE